MLLGVFLLQVQSSAESLPLHLRAWAGASSFSSSSLMLAIVRVCGDSALASPQLLQTVSLWPLPNTRARTPVGWSFWGNGSRRGGHVDLGSWERNSECQCWGRSRLGTFIRPCRLSIPELAGAFRRNRRGPRTAATLMPPSSFLSLTFLTLDRSASFCLILCFYSKIHLDPYLICS